MNYKNIITKATSCLLLAACLLSIFASATSAAAVDIQGAFSDNEGAVAREYMDKYGWDEEQFRVRTWSADIDGETVEFEREAGYQTKFLDDNILTTQKYLGLSGNGSGALDSSGAADLVKIALEEVSAEDNAENPEDSNNVKYNTWFFGKDVTGDQYSWSATFVSWCADKCGLISTKLFKKTNSCADLYKYMINDNGFMSYETKNSTTFGGPEYTPVPGDLMFMYDGNDISTCNRVGIIVSVTNNTIYVVEGDSNGKVEKKGFNKNTEDSDVLNGRIVHVEYPLTFADGGSTEANAPIIFNFLTSYMNFSAAAACGAMGNMMAESHLIPDTTEYGYTWETGAGYGLVQWTNTNKNGRIRGSDSANTVPSGSTTFTWISGHNRTNLVNWCTVNGYDYKSLSGQLYFLKYWLTGKENNTYFSRYLSKLSQQPNTAAGAQQCSDIWLQYIEGLPRSNRHWASQSPARKNNTNQFWAQFGQGVGN